MLFVYFFYRTKSDGFVNLHPSSVIAHSKFEIISKKHNYLSTMFRVELPQKVTINSFEENYFDIRSGQRSWPNSILV